MSAQMGTNKVHGILREPIWWRFFLNETMPLSRKRHRTNAPVVPNIDKKTQHPPTSITPK